MLTLRAAAAAGLVCGVLSGFGIGGGSLLMGWMTAVLSMEQRAAQGVNLLYFLPCAACALIFHIKNKQIVWRAVWPAALAGSVCAVGGALLAQNVDAELLRKLFGGFLVLVGLSEIILKGLKQSKPEGSTSFFLCCRDCRQHCRGHLSGPAGPAGPRDRPDGQISSEYHRGVGRLLISPFPCISGRVHPDPPKAGLLFACRGLPAFVRDLGL